MSVWRRHTAGKHTHGSLGLVDVEGGTLRDTNQLLHDVVLGANVSVEFVFFTEAIEREGGGREEGERDREREGERERETERER